MGSTPSTATDRQIETQMPPFQGRDTSSRSLMAEDRVLSAAPLRSRCWALPRLISACAMVRFHRLRPTVVVQLQDGGLQRESFAQRAYDARVCTTNLESVHRGVLAFHRAWPQVLVRVQSAVELFDRCSEGSAITRALRSDSPRARDVRLRGSFALRFPSAPARAYARHLHRAC